MATRGAVAIRNPNGGIQGRYVHWDGHVLESQVRRLIARDGVKKVVQTIIFDNYGWSDLDSTLGVNEEPTLGSGYTDGRFKAVAGYGTAYTTVQGQSSPDDWITGLGQMGTEYIVVIEQDGSLTVWTEYEDDER